MVIVDSKEAAMMTFSTRSSSEFDAELPTYEEANLDREEEANRSAANNAGAHTKDLRRHVADGRTDVAAASTFTTASGSAAGAGPSVPSPNPITPALSTRSVPVQPPDSPPPAGVVVASPVPTVSSSPSFPTLGPSAPPGFSRLPPAQYSYKPFRALCLPSKRGPWQGLKQAVEFPQEPPASHLSPHPFSEHDVTEDDWVRFLSDLQSIVNAPSPNAPPPRAAEALPVARSFGLSGMDYLLLRPSTYLTESWLRSSSYVTESVYNLRQMAKSLIEAPTPSRLYEHVAQLVDGWNNHFFRPRRMDAVLLRGGVRVGGSGNVPPALKHELAHVMRVHREREQRHSRRDYSSSDSSDSSDSSSDSESEDDLYEPYPPAAPATNAAAVPTAAGPAIAPTTVLGGVSAVAAKAAATQDFRTLRSLAKAAQKADKDVRKASKRVEKDMRKAAKKAVKDVKRAMQKAVKRERRAEKRERWRGIPKDRSAQGPSGSEPVDDGVWRVFLLPAGSY